MANINSMQELLEASKPKIKKVKTAGYWGKDVYVRQFDAQGFSRFVTFIGGKDGFTSEQTAMVCVMSMCKSGGDLLVPPKQWEKAAKTLAKGDGAALNTVAMAALTVSGLTKSEADEAGKQ